MKKRKLTKEEKVVKYIWEQIERWLLYRYKIDKRVNVVTDYLYRNGLFSRVDYKGRDIYITVDKKIIREGNKQDYLNIVGRSAVQIYFNYQGKEFNESQDEISEELKKYGLPNYGTLPQIGLKLRQYTCSKCNNIVRVSIKKVSKTEEFEYNPKKLTSCCHAVIKDDGWVQFSNQDAQRLLTTLASK